MRFQQTTHQDAEHHRRDYFVKHNGEGVYVHVSETCHSNSHFCLWRYIRVRSYCAKSYKPYKLLDHQATTGRTPDERNGTL
jgi:hypothetical protein